MTTPSDTASTEIYETRTCAPQHAKTHHALRPRRATGKPLSPREANQKNVEVRNQWHKLHKENKAGGQYHALLLQVATPQPRVVSKRRTQEVVVFWNSRGRRGVIQ